MQMMILGMVYGNLWHCLNLQDAMMIPEDRKVLAKSDRYLADLYPVNEQLLMLSGAHWLGYPLVSTFTLC